MKFSAELPCDKRMQQRLGKDKRVACLKLPFLAPCQSSVCVDNGRRVQGWGVRGLEALNTFSIPCSPGALLLVLLALSCVCTGNQGVCLGRAGSREDAGA